MFPVTVPLKAVAATSAIAFGLIISQTSAFAARACTNTEIRTIVTSEFIVACTGVGGTVKCDSGRQVCCKTYKRPGGWTATHCSTSVNSLPPSRVSNPPASRPPRAGTDVPPGGRIDPPVSRPPRTDPPPGSVAPPQNPRPLRADPPSSKVAPPKSSGPSIR